MRTVPFTMSLAGTLTLFCCLLFLGLFRRSLKAKWRRTLLLFTLTFYLLPLPYLKFILLQGAKALHIIPDTSVVSPGTELLTNYPYMVFIDAAGRSFYSEAQTLLIVINSLLLTVSAGILLYQIANCIRIKMAIQICSQPAGAEETALLEELKVCMGIRRRVRLAQSDKVSIPVVSGVFSPMILLPSGKRADNRVLKSMLMHELAHIKHQDILLQWVGMLAAALHWYNPFSRLLLHLLAEANEQYSDAEVIHTLSEQEKRRYCEDLIHYSEPSGMEERTLAVLGFSKNAKKQIRGRIDEVLNKKRRRPGIAVCAGAFILLIGTAAAFVYQPPLTMQSPVPDSINTEMLFDEDVEIYFKSWGAETDI